LPSRGRRRSLNARGLTFTILSWLCGAVAFAVLLGAPARAAAQFGSAGEGAGQFIEPRGVAVDQGNGDVYIVDRNNNRVDKFTSQGAFVLAWGWGVADGTTEALQTCTTICFTGLGGAGAGQFSFPQGVAVDNDPLSPSYEDVYVADVRNQRVEKFSPTGELLLILGVGVSETGAIATGPSGEVYIGDIGGVLEFGSGGGYVGQFANASGGCTTGLAVNSMGDVYVTESYKNPEYPDLCGEYEPGVREYDSSGALLNTLASEDYVDQMAVDSTDDLFVTELSGTTQREHFIEYNSAGTELSRFAADEMDGSKGLAWGDMIGKLYAVNRQAVQLLSPPPPGPLVGDESVSGVASTSVTLNAIVNPEGYATKYRFEYGPSTSYGTSVPVPEGSLVGGFEDEPVQAKLKGLTAGASYHYRVMATDSDGHVTAGPDETFTTLPAVSIDEVYVNEVASTSVTFGAQINPLGVEASYHLEYGTSTSYGTVVSEGPLGKGSGEVITSPAHVQGLTPDTIYHYRVVAFDEREGVSYTVEGSDHTFTTQGAGSELALLDGRQWELVSPPDNHGAVFSHISESGVIQSSASGGGMTYLASIPPEAQPRGGYREEVQVLSQRGPASWLSRDIATAHSAPSGASLAHGEEYRFFSEDLSLGLVEPWDEGYFTSLAPEVSPPDTETTVYLRHDATCESTPATCYMPLVTGAPGYADVQTGTKFGSENSGTGSVLNFQGATPDLSHVLLLSNVALTSKPPNGGGLYEWSGSEPPADELRLVSVLPEGTATKDVALGISGNTRGAISDDGSRVFMSSEASGALHLYMRDTVKEETVELDVVQPDAPKLGVEPEPHFQIASSNGSKVFFTDSQPLTSGAGSNSNEGIEGDLYECTIVETAGEDKCVLSDLTPEVAGQAADVQGGVLGASEDGSYVYLVADGVLTEAANGAGEKAVPGHCSGVQGRLPSGVTCNLYMLHYDASSGEWEVPQFIAGLSGEDLPDWESRLSTHTARVSPDGHYLAFMSDRSLTGYNNRDANSDVPDEEVFVYDASAGRLVCASCDPTGARPVGVEWDEGNNMNMASGGRIQWGEATWLAANIPGWTSFGEGEAAYQSRYLSNEGRLFFNSHDALVPQDINGTEDVYEYEPAGVGDCLTSSSTFGIASSGCVDLISSGTSAQEAAFLDASESGDDVFFLTSEKLVPQAVGNGSAVYDAHACSAQSPCFSAPASPPPCTTVESCRASPTPQPSIFGDPSSATFSGAGNVASPLSAPALMPKTLTRAQKLAAALKACRAQGNRRTRASCETRARKRYGSKAKAKKTSAKTKKRGGVR
jgi:NHL repeat/WD40-like Beta Propeller Repeat